MKLFFSPGACALSPHIILNELGMKFDLERVDLKAHTTSSGDYYKQNPKGYVPALLLENGELLTEGAVIAQYLADQKPEANLIPKAGTWERYRAMEWLNFISSELHKTFTPLFAINSLTKSEEARAEIAEFFKARLGKRLDIVNENLGKNRFMMGDAFTVVDAYLYNILTWTVPMKIDLGHWKNIKTWFEQVGARPSVKNAHEKEKHTK